jgi:hypothetical protein
LLCYRPRLTIRQHLDHFIPNEPIAGDNLAPAKCLSR